MEPASLDRRDDRSLMVHRSVVVAPAMVREAQIVSAHELKVRVFQVARNDDGLFASFNRSVMVAGYPKIVGKQARDPARSFLILKSARKRSGLTEIVEYALEVP